MLLFATLTNGDKKRDCKNFGLNIQSITSKSQSLDVILKMKITSFQRRHKAQLYNHKQTNTKYYTWIVRTINLV